MIDGIREVANPLIRFAVLVLACKRVIEAPNLGFLKLFVGRIGRRLIVIASEGLVQIMK